MARAKRATSLNRIANDSRTNADHMYVWTEDLGNGCTAELEKTKEMFSNHIGALFMVHSDFSDENEGMILQSCYSHHALFYNPQRQRMESYDYYYLYTTGAFLLSPAFAN